MTKRILCVIMAVAVVSSATCSEWKSPPSKAHKSAKIFSKSYADGHGDATSIGSSSETAWATPDFDGSISMSGSFTQVGKHSEGYADSVAHAQATDSHYEEHTQADTSSSAKMTNYHHVPNSNTHTTFFSVADGHRPFASSGGRDVVLNTPHLAGAFSQAAGGAAVNEPSLEHGFGFLRLAAEVNPNFPQPVLTGLEGFVPAGRKLLTSPLHYSAYAKTSGGSEGFAHGSMATALGGNVGASFDNPFARASIADSIDYVSAGPVHGEAKANSSVITSTKHTDAFTKGLAYQKTDYYVPLGVANSEVGAMAKGANLDFADGVDISIVTPHWTGAHARGESGAAKSDAGLWGTLNNLAIMATRFPTLVIPDIDPHYVGK